MSETLKQRAELLRVLGRRFRTLKAEAAKERWLAFVKKHRPKVQKMADSFAAIRMGEIEASRMTKGKALVKGLIAALRGDNDRSMGLLTRGMYEDGLKLSRGEKLEPSVTEEDIVEAITEEAREKH